MSVTFFFAFTVVGSIEVLSLVVNTYELPTSRRWPFMNHFSENRNFCFV